MYVSIVTMDSAGTFPGPFMKMRRSVSQTLSAAARECDGRLTDCDRRIEFRYFVSDVVARGVRGAVPLKVVPCCCGGG